MSATAGEPELGFQRFDCIGEEPGVYAAAIEAARGAVEAGECIVLPTDTVYGIGADAFSAEAVQRLLNAKGRGRDMPPPVLIGESSLIRALAVDVSDQAKGLIDRHWPGALTVICRIQPSLRMDLGDSKDTIALRVPDHELAREILRRTGPMAISSANLSGQPAARTCDEAIDQLGESVAVYLDGGELAASGGLPSTIVDFTRRDEGEVLRVGALSVELLRETLPDLADLTDTSEPPEDADPADADSDEVRPSDRPDEGGLGSTEQEDSERLRSPGSLSRSDSDEVRPSDRPTQEGLV